MSKNNFFISTAIPYVNADPHIGFALELIQADVIARAHRQRGESVFFLNGTDENSLKNVQAAERANVPVATFVEQHAEVFRQLSRVLNISNDDFIRTTEERHIQGAQKLWQSCNPEDMYKKSYKGLYCVGCEEFKTPKELIDGLCPEHKTKPEEVEEENYFFRLSKYQDKLLNLLESGNLKITPSSRRNELTEFIKQGLEDFSISRSKERAHNWGISVPGDDTQIMYVWFDALTNYINALGYAKNAEQFQEWWEGGFATHLIGKGITRFHAIYWPAMLLSAGVSLPKEIFVHGYVTVDGQKISKSLGNTIDPFEVIKKYGADVVRYFLLREIPSGDDGDFSYKNLEARYNSDLANGLGNYTARVLTLAAKETFDGTEVVAPEVDAKIRETKARVDSKIGEFKLHEALATVWELVAFGDAYINEKQAWRRTDRNVIFGLVALLDNVALLLQPFLPTTAQKITSHITWQNNVLAVTKGEVLFPRHEAL